MTWSTGSGSASMPSVAPRPRSGGQRRQPRHPAGLPPRPEPGGAAGAGRGGHHPGPAAAGRGGPLLLVATVVLSFAAALGVRTLVFDHLFGFAGADPAFPLWTFVFLVALGTDYNIFLMTRVHEESKLHGTRRGALIGLAATGGVITSAGIVLAGTFAALGTLPLVFVTEIGFAVAFGVLLDTFVVRSVLVTALNLDVGRRIWWPSSLARKQDVSLDELAEDTSAALTR